MPEPPVETKNPHPSAEDPAIDDMMDGRDIHQWPEQFGQVISYIHTSLYEEYTRHDRIAIDQQGKHRWASRIAIGFGTAAILMSLTGIVLEAKGSSVGIFFPGNYAPWVWAVELAASVIAIVCILVGKFITHWHQNWLVERFCAEEYRTRKFRALLHPTLICNEGIPWEERFSRWKTWFDGEVRAANTGMTRDIRHCTVSDTVSPPPPATCGLSLDQEYLRALMDYYLEKRLMTQIAYFDKRSVELEHKDTLFRKILDMGFYLGILLVPVNVGIEHFIQDPAGTLTGVKIGILLLMVNLPIIAFAVRTWRSSSEVARSASLFQAKRNSLVEFRNLLDIENKKDPHNWDQIVKILWECESSLVEVNREWVRTLKEAEWFV
jgi:hypothetical protein